MTPTNPPIYELAIGVQFASERPVDSHKIVLFWNESLRSEFPECVETLPIEDEFEKFDEPSTKLPNLLQFRVNQRPEVRYQFSDSLTGRVVQLQSTRMTTNWVRGKTIYPRYSVVKATFDRIYLKWQEFAANSKIGDIVPNQWELIYVNIIPQGELWLTPNEWNRISPIFSPYVETSLILEGRNFQWRMKMPNQIGRITLTAVPVRNNDGNEALQITIVARGPASSISEVQERLNLAHVSILGLFDKLTTEEAKKHWGVRS